MRKQQTNRIKFKVWHERGSMEYDGSTVEGLHYAAHILTADARQALIDSLIELQEKLGSTSK